MIIFPSPSFVRLAAPVARALQANAPVRAPSQIKNSNAVPARRSGLRNYAQATRAWMPPAPSAFRPLQQAVAKAAPAASFPSASPAVRKLCAFTGITLSNGRLSHTEARAFLARPAATFRTASHVPTAATHTPRVLPSFGVPMVAAAACTVGNASQPVHASQPVDPHRSTPLQPTSNPAERNGETVLESIRQIKQLWINGHFLKRSESAPTLSSASEAVNRIMNEISQARHSGR